MGKKTTLRRRWRTGVTEWRLLCIEFSQGTCQPWGSWWSKTPKRLFLMGFVFRSTLGLKESFLFLHHLWVFPSNPCWDLKRLKCQCCGRNWWEALWPALVLDHYYLGQRRSLRTPAWLTRVLYWGLGPGPHLKLKRSFLCLALFSDSIPTSMTFQEIKFQGRIVLLLRNPAKYSCNSISIST